MSPPATALAAVLTMAGAEPLPEAGLEAPTIPIEVAEQAPGQAEAGAPAAVAPVEQDQPEPAAVAGEEVDAAAAQDGSTQGRKDILVQATLEAPEEDPLQKVNVQTFEAVQVVDKALVEPVAHGYIAVVPKPLRDGIHNVVTNLDEPIVFLSFMLQFKPLSALKTLGRFVINSTLGLAGLFDVAKSKPFNAPHVKNGFGYTMAYYGVKPGPFLYLPLIGSTTLRDLVGQLAQIPVLPLAIGKPFNKPVYYIPKATITALDDRVQDDERIRQIHAESSNPYSVYRSYYLRKRQAEVDYLKGLREDTEVPVFEDEILDMEDEAEPVEAGESPAPASDEAAGEAEAPVPQSEAPAEAEQPLDDTALLLVPVAAAVALAE